MTSRKVGCRRAWIFTKSPKNLEENVSYAKIAKDLWEIDVKLYELEMVLKYNEIEQKTFKVEIDKFRKRPTDLRNVERNMQAQEKQGKSSNK